MSFVKHINETEEDLLWNAERPNTLGFFISVHISVIYDKRSPHIW
jgi:hypothetical protein